MDPEAFDLSKENIQPLRQGRLTNQLGVALQAETDPEAHLQLVKEKESFEILIRTYDGDDPLDPWFRYVLWVEQVYLKRGREGNLQVLLERCISHFKDNPRYQQDSRFVQLCLKFIEMSSAPLELYKQCHASGIGTQCALFYVSWAFALECSGDMKRANRILEEGLKNNAWPLEQMRDAHRIFQLRVAKQVLYDGADMRSEAEQEHREVLARIHQRMGNTRTAQGSAGVFQVHGQIRRNTNASIKPFNDENSEVNELYSIGNYHGTAMPRKTISNKENIQQPAPWVPKQPAHRPQSVAPPATRRRAQNPDFQLHHDEEVSAPSAPSAFVSNVLKPRKLDEDNFACALAVFEPPDPTKRPMYCKDKVYAGGTEFSLEELRAIAYLKGNIPKRKRPEMKDDENIEIQHDVVEQMLKRDSSFECPLVVFEPPDPTKKVQYCRNKVYQGNKEFSLEELRAEVYLNGRQLPKSRKAETAEQNGNDDFTCPLAVFESPDPKRKRMYRKSEVYADNTEYSLEEIRARDPKYCVIPAAAVAERTLDESLTVAKLFGEELHQLKLFTSTKKQNFVHNDSLMMTHYLRDMPDIRQENVSGIFSHTPSVSSDTMNGSIFEAQIFGKDNIPKYVLESPANIEVPSFHPYVDNTKKTPKHMLPEEPFLQGHDVPQVFSKAFTPSFAVYVDEDDVLKQSSVTDQDIPFTLHEDDDLKNDDRKSHGIPSATDLQERLPYNTCNNPEDMYKENIALQQPLSFQTTACLPMHSSDKKRMPAFTPYVDDAYIVTPTFTPDAVRVEDTAGVECLYSIQRSEPGLISNQEMQKRPSRKSTIFHHPPGFGVCLDEEECDPMLNSASKQEQLMGDGISPHQMTKQSPNHSYASFTTNTKEAQNLMQELWRDSEVRPAENNLVDVKNVAVNPVEEQILNDRPMPTEPEFEIFKDKSDCSLKLTPAVSEIPLVPSPGMTLQEEMRLLGTEMKENVSPEDLPVPERPPGPISGALQPSMRVPIEIIQDGFDENVTCNTAAFKFPLLSSTPAINHTKEQTTTEEISKSVNKFSLYPSGNLSIISEGSETKTSSSSGSSVQPTMRHTTIPNYTHSTLAVVQEQRAIEEIPPQSDQEFAATKAFAAVAQKLEYDDITVDMSKLTMDEKPAAVEEVEENVAVAEVPEVSKESLAKVDPFDKTMIIELLRQIHFPASRHKDRYIKLDTRVPVCKAKSSLTFGKDRYTLECVLGEGSYAKVYKAVEAKTNKKVALKIQRPAWEWEMYICREIQLRLSDPIQALAFMDVNIMYVLNNGSILVSDCALHGSLLSVINKFKIANESVPEVLALYWLAELLALGDALHKCKIIHGDIKPDNFVVRALPSLDHPEPSLQLIDMGRGIDMTLFPPNTCFNVVVTTNSFKCIEMQTNRPWTYQTDLFGIAATAHCILFGNYMKVYPKGNRWSNFGSMRRSSNRTLWEKFFDTMLNIESCSHMPDLSNLHDEVLEALHTLVNSDKRVSNSFAKAVFLIESK